MDESLLRPVIGLYEAIPLVGTNHLTVPRITKCSPDKKNAASSSRGRLSLDVLDAALESRGVVPLLEKADGVILIEDEEGVQRLATLTIGDEMNDAGVLR